MKENKNVLCVISKATYGDYAARDLQTNSGWTDNPYGEEYAIVPENMIESILKTKGFCDIELNEEETEVVSFVARKIPEIPKPDVPPTAIEQLRADVEFLALMTGVNL